MNADLPRIIDAFSGLRVLVVGEAMLDVYFHGETSRFCPEAPAPVVDVRSIGEQPGGAANGAVNLRALGARPVFLSVVGDDPEGASLRDRLEARGVDAGELVVAPGRRTLAKRRVVAADHLLVRFDEGDARPIPTAAEEELIARLDAAWRTCDAVLVSDYGYGVLTDRVIAALASLQAEARRALVVDSKRLSLYRGVRPTAVKPNFAEASRLLGESGPPAREDRAEWAIARGPRILEETGARIAAVTLDVEGALVLERDRPPYRTFAKPESSSRASGAGDTFAAVMTLALAAGADAPAAADLASTAAAIVVAERETATCRAVDLRERVHPDRKTLAGVDELAERVAAHRRAGRRVVYTNGCFDILHRGHVSYLSRAKALGDVLIVGVNGDAGIRRLKGPSRPINGLHDRLQVLTALSCVDHVVSFDEDTPHALIRVVRPDVFVKGGDYTRESLPEAGLVEELGGVVRIMPFLADRSTTDIIDKIRRAYGESIDAVAVPCPAGGVAS
ncbi:D-glycero-beta-D-manno-heptose 1-phosphate adenylyltransferase [Paludisphaera sp.]|uniref:D-glycero-beta-D-manno-heptose 1-phosphate adenylyltransferase n=1 Tax=Paludisphaera sp. TaxID=2017432 RepID=UPI00301B836E